MGGRGDCVRSSRLSGYSKTLKENSGASEDIRLLNGRTYYKNKHKT